MNIRIDPVTPENHCRRNSSAACSNTKKIVFTNSCQTKSAKTPDVHRGPITIKNYHHVDDILTRGAKPTEAQILELQKHGYKHIISFCTNYGAATTSYNELPKEAEWAREAGIDFHWLPFSSKNTPSKKNIKKFFDITDKARMNNERVFVHCRHGADRTGVFSAMYKIRNYNTDLCDAIKEMFEYGHDANGNKNLIPFLADFKKTNGIFGFNIKGPLIRLAAKAKKIFVKMKI